MFGLGAGELFLIFLIALFFLGPKKLPELAKGLGSALREFNKAKEQVMHEIQKSPEEEARKKAEDEKLIAVEKPQEEVMTKKPENLS